MEVGLEVNVKYTKYMLSYYQKAGRRHSIKMASRFIEDVAKLKFLGTLTDKNCIPREFKIRLNLGNACYRLIQSLLSSRLLSRNAKVKIYETIILPGGLYGCEAWSLILRREDRLKLF
jgi:hypothetical protein